MCNAIATCSAGAWRDWHLMTELKRGRLRARRSCLHKAALSRLNGQLFGRLGCTLLRSRRCLLQLGRTLILLTHATNQVVLLGDRALLLLLQNDKLVVGRSGRSRRFEPPRRAPSERQRRHIAPRSHTKSLINFDAGDYTVFYSVTARLADSSAGVKVVLLSLYIYMYSTMCSGDVFPKL